MTVTDFPNVRTSAFCPLCDKHKDDGLLVCWSCYKTHDLRYGNPDAEVLIARVESKLSVEIELT